MQHTALRATLHLNDKFTPRVRQLHRRVVINAINTHVDLYPTVSFTEGCDDDGVAIVTQRPNSPDRNSLDPRVRDLWDEYDNA